MKKCDVTYKIIILLLSSNAWQPTMFEVLPHGIRYSGSIRYVWRAWACMGLMYWNCITMILVRPGGKIKGDLALQKLIWTNVGHISIDADHQMTSPYVTSGSIRYVWRAWACLGLMYWNCITMVLVRPDGKIKGVFDVAKNDLNICWPECHRCDHQMQLPLRNVSFHTFCLHGHACGLCIVILQWFWRAQSDKH